MLVYQRVSQSTPKKHIAKSVWNPIPTRKLVSSWFPIVFPGNFEPWPWLPSGLPTHGLAGDFEVKPSDQWFPAWPRGSPCRWSKATKMTQVRLGAGHKMTCNRWPAFPSWSLSKDRHQNSHLSPWWFITFHHLCKIAENSGPKHLLDVLLPNTLEFRLTRALSSVANHHHWILDPLVNYHSYGKWP